MKKYLLISIIIFALITIVSCNEDIADNPAGNKPPETSLSLFPDSSISPQPSKLKVAWWGDDTDGLIVGFYYSFDGINWIFTNKNELQFSLKIGAGDTTYNFKVSSVDNGGNGIYDNNIFQNNINYGPESFVDANNDGIYNNGEKFYDIGLIDPTPASLDYPLKNTAPTIEWNVLSTLPAVSFPVMSFGWNADDLDGIETIEKINVVLNDTTNVDNKISLDGSVRTITIRTKDFSSANPLSEILIEGIETNIFSQKLPGLKLDDYNHIYVQAVDISGATSNFISLPEKGKTWFVKKPKGSVIIMDDYATSDGASAFYDSMMDSLGLSGKYDIYDFLNQKPPYTNVTFLQTIKLFKYVLWYSDNNPSLDLAASSVQKYIDYGGKIAFSMQFPQTVDPLLLQNFLPINSDSLYSRTSILPSTIVSAETTNGSYPTLTISTSLFRIKSFYLNPNGAIPLYYFPNKELKGFIGFFNNTKSIYFYGLPLSKSNGGQANVKKLLTKIFFEDFGVTP
ncbi:MAG: hypothetical protein WAV89_10095 [Ignavibacteriaceae bacterium]